MNLLKPLIGLALVVATILIVFAGGAQWLVLLFGALFTLAYINGKWGVWRSLFQNRDRRFYQSLGATYVVETIIVFSLYWLGRGTAGLL
mgnify:CR=1 FL=1